MAESWYYAKGGERFGPFAEEDIVKMIGDGTITSSTNLWREGMDDWKKAVETEFTGHFSQSAPSSDAVNSQECVICKKAFSENELVDVDGHLVCSACKPQMLRRLQEGVTAPGYYRYGGFWIRVCAYILDGIILNLIQLPLTIFNGVVAASAEGKNTFMSQIVTSLIGLVIGIIYSVFFVHKKGATPGKMAFGLKIINADGTDGISIGKAVGRYFAQILSGLIFCIGFIMVAFDDRKRGLHDRICETLVVYKK